ncbi:class I SAM-dependent methyltransferase [Dapis sp. BLCC M126]|uniref:class I SAM-dependent methyltransferase n=1 Tax=Dapis sp. BLCC M126 TaxID=3400189 RepID=UPI003CF8ECE3
MSLQQFPNPALNHLKVGSFAEYQSLLIVDRELYLLMQDVEKAILYQEQGKNNFQVNGYCHVCNSESYFLVNYNHGYEVDGFKFPNWRESLFCPQCSLNNRMRSILHIFDLECNPQKNVSIYLTEQVTPLYQYIKQRFPLTTGSEYLGNDIAPGSLNAQGIRNESLTNLSFDNYQFDFLLSFDVFEHIPHYQKAFSECFRVLKTGGKMIFSVPFCKWSETNIIRAKVGDDGKIIHLKEPVYHGDPLNKDGILCFQDFGWEMLNELREVGFQEVTAIIYGSRFYGYLGGGHIAFIARKM